MTGLPALVIPAATSAQNPIWVTDYISRSCQLEYHKLGNQLTKHPHCDSIAFILSKLPVRVAPPAFDFKLALPRAVHSPVASAASCVTQSALSHHSTPLLVFSNQSHNPSKSVQVTSHPASTNAVSSSSIGATIVESSGRTSLSFSSQSLVQDGQQTICKPIFFSRQPPCPL